MAVNMLHLGHLSDIALKHVAACYGLEPHQDRAQLMHTISQHLLSTLHYNWETSVFAGKLPSAAYGFSLVPYEGELYLFGGRNGLTNQAMDLMTYEPSSDEWTVVDELSGGQSVASRRWHSAYVHDDKMLVVGGQVWLDEAWQESSSMVQFDLMRRTWSEVKQHGEQPAPRMKCASATIGNQLFMLSGDDAHTSTYGSIYLFNLETHSWTMRACSGRVPDTKAVEAMAAHEGSIYAITADKTAECVQVYRLDSSSFVWSLIDTTGAAPTNRQQFAAASYEDQWIISGGVLAGTQFVVGGMYSYDFESSSWSAVAEALQREDVDLTKRACHTAAVLGGKLYTTGGWHGGWPRLLDGIALSKHYLAADDDSDLPASSSSPAASAAPAAASGVPNCELPRLVARCRRDHLSYADVMLVAADGTEYACHKVVLAAQSEVFDRMLQAEMQEAATGRVIMDDISAAALDALLHYLYGGCSRLKPAIAIELFAVADKYGISGLKAECILNMQQCLEVDNVALVAQLASLHDLQSLWEACVAFTSQFKVQPMVFASRAYCEMWVGNPAAAQEFTMQVAARAAESYQQVAAEASST